MTARLYEDTSRNPSARFLRLVGHLARVPA